MDLFDRLIELNNKGIIIDIVAINQIDNGYEEQFKAGNIPLVTYTAEIMNNNLDDILYQESCNTFKEALEAGIKWGERYNR